MSARLPLLVAVAAFSLACSGLVPAPPPAPEVPLIVPGTPPAAGSAVEPSPQPVPATESPAPSGPCADDCLLLMEHRYTELASGGYCELCKDQDPQACELDWPSSDRITCEEADRLRNCIYARLGYDFSSAPEWRVVFEEEPWYEVNPRFKWSDVTDVQVDNANTLKDIVKRRRCTR